jgi:hypothetical protein
MGRGTGPVFETHDGRYRVRAPGMALEKSSHESNVLRVADKIQAVNLYEEKKIDFKATTVDEFMTREVNAKINDKQKQLAPVAKLTINGRPARQTEIDVIIEEDRWRELFTVIDYPDEWLEVSIVVKPSKYDRTKAAAIVQTVETTGKPASP